MFWKDERQCMAGTSRASASTPPGFVPDVASGEAMQDAVVLARARFEQPRHEVCWVGLGFFIGRGDTCHLRLPAPWVSSSARLPPTVDSSVPTTLPVNLPPGVQPSASDGDSSFDGYHTVVCPLPLRVEDAFSCYREDDSDWIDAVRVQLFCPASRL